jgi:SPP1 gp7 family putative phage head morphogenesis protein
MTATWGPLQPEAAISYFLGKLSRPSEYWAEVYGAANARYFAVAGAVEADLIEDLRREIERALTEGISLQEFTRSFREIVERRGWVHFGEPGWRAMIIYRTNLSTAYAAGEWQAMRDPDVMSFMPYWEYRHSGSAHPRPHHRAWDGLILSAEDPWWSTHYPPNGWMCGCWVNAMTRRQAAARGRTAPDTAPQITYREWTDRRTGEIRQVPVGIDPSFEHSPGEAWAKR